MRQLQYPTSVKSVDFTKTCGITKDEFEVKITFLPESSVPNDDNTWITFNFNNQLIDGQDLYCEPVKNVKQCYFLKNSTKSDNAILKITQIQEKGQNNYLDFESDEVDYFCLSPYCIDSSKTYKFNPEDDEEFTINFNGTIDNDTKLYIDENIELNCTKASNTAMTCSKKDNNNISTSTEPYSIYMFLCDEIRDTGIKLTVTSGSNFVEISFLIYLFSLFIF